MVRQAGADSASREMVATSGTMESESDERAAEAERVIAAPPELSARHPHHRPVETLRSATGRLCKSLDLKKLAASWQLLRQKDFRLYFFGNLTSNLGTWLQSTAQVLIAYRLTNSAFAVGLIASAQFAGMVLVSPWAAVLLTRFSPRAILIGTQSASAILAILMAWRYLNGALGLHTLLIGALGLGFAYALALPVQTALVPALVSEADIADALRMNSASYNAARALAPALSLLVIASFGLAIVFLLNAISFILFVVLLRRLHRISLETSFRATMALPFKHARNLARSAVSPAYNRLSDAEVPAAITCTPNRLPRTSPYQLKSADTKPSLPPLVRSRARVTDGLVIAFRHRRILLLLAIVGAVTLADDPVLVLSPALAHTKLHASGEWSAYFIAALGWGSVAGTLTPRSRKDQGTQSASRYAALSLLALGVSVVVFVAGFSPLVSLAAAIAAGAAGLFTGTAAQSALLRHQKETVASMATVASVTALWAIAWAGTKPFASLLDGWLATHTGMLNASLVLASPAVTIALCELLLPRKVKASINSSAEGITHKVPRSIRAARAFLHRRRLRIASRGFRVAGQIALADVAHSAISRIIGHLRLLGTDHAAGWRIQGGVFAKASDEAPVTR